MNLWRTFLQSATRKLAYILVGLASALALTYCGSAHAEGQVPYIPGATLYNYVGTGINASATTPEAACAQITSQSIAWYLTHPIYAGTYLDWAPNSVTSAYCVLQGYIKNSSTNANVEFKDSQYTFSTSTGSQSCPANSSANGGGCQCQTNYIPDAGGLACIPKPSACAPTLAKPATGEVHAAVSGQFVPTKVCIAGCGYIPYGGGMSGTWATLAGQWTYIGRPGQWIGDGTVCAGAPVGTPSTTPDAPPTADPTPPPPGQCRGTVNGVVVVVPCDGTSTGSGGPAAPSPAASGVPPVPGSGDPGASNGPGSLSPQPPASAPPGSKPGDKGTTTNCKDGVCDTTDCMIVIQANGDYVKECTVKGEDQGTFCANNPGSPNCGGVDRCKNDTSVGCMKPGSVTPTPLHTTAVQMSIAPQSGFGASNGTCPAPRTIVLGGRSFSFSWQAFCDFANGVRPIVIAVAWLLAAMSFVGLSRKE